MKTVLVTDHVFPNRDPENAVLEGIGTLREAGPVKDAELLELARDADAVLNCYRPLSAEIVEAMKNCRVIARYGIGVDTIPLEVATSHGIQVTNVPDYCIEEVAVSRLGADPGIHARYHPRSGSDPRRRLEREIASTGSPPARSDT